MGTIFLILFLKIVKELASLISLGISFHILATIIAMDSIPKCVEWILYLERQLPYLNSHAEFFETLKILFMILGEIFILTLKIFIANNYRFL